MSLSLLVHYKDEHSCFQVWTNIKDALVERLEDLKAARLKTLRRITMLRRYELISSVRAKYFESLPPDAIVPPISDIALLDSVQAIIHDIPVTETVTVEKHFTPFIEKELPDFTREWRKAKDEELVEIMKTNSPDATLASLNLASTFFACGHCREKIGYPRILAHRCLTACRYINNMPPEVNEVQQALVRLPWNYENNISVRSSVHNSARSLLEACGLDADTVLSSEVTDLDTFVECMTCRSDTARCIMRVPTAVSILIAVSGVQHINFLSFLQLIHDHDQFGSRATPKESGWKVITGEDAVLAKKLEDDKKLARSNPSWASPHYCCKRCRWKSMFGELRHHVKEVYVFIVRTWGFAN